jgi:hypothetical protein
MSRQSRPSLYRETGYTVDVVVSSKMDMFYFIVFTYNMGVEAVL